MSGLNIHCEGWNCPFNGKNVNHRAGQLTFAGADAQKAGRGSADSWAAHEKG
jgi:hypothetical protein